MSAPDEKFKGMMDALIMSTKKDTELAKGLRWIDEQAAKKDLSFYEMAFIIMQEHMAAKRAREWLKNK